jgi:hypothetical protein
MTFMLAPRNQSRKRGQVVLTSAMAVRFIDYVSLPTLQITQGAPSKFKDPQSAPS